MSAKPPTVRAKGFQSKSAVPPAPTPEPVAAPEPVVLAAPSVPNLELPLNPAAAPEKPVEIALSEEERAQEVPDAAPASPDQVAAAREAKPPKDAKPRIGSFQSPRAEATAIGVAGVSAAAAAPEPAAPPSAPQSYEPDTDPGRVLRRQWWKYNLYVKSGRQVADQAQS